MTNYFHDNAIDTQGYVFYNEYVVHNMAEGRL